ncbi:unnamed protein product [Clavelina lepadiformis]|uniref:Cytochrome P450 n=1 Tax=Clavelina lepadiformis TaxID=159417 RepID=A0ABP0FG90_CLALP
MILLDWTNYLNLYTLMSLIGVLLLYWYRRPAKLPPGPRGIPIFGVLPFLGKYGERKIAQWSKTYGPVISLRFGRNDVIFLNDFDSIHEALVKQQTKFSGRPKFALPFITDIAKGSGYVGLDYGDFYKAQKKFGLTALRGFGVGNRSMEDRVQEEDTFLNEAIRSMDGKAFNISKYIHKAISNNICSVVFGERFDYDDEYMEDIMSRLLKLLDDPTNAAAMRICMFAPGLRNLPPIGFVHSRFKKKISVALEFIRKKIEEHNKTFNEDDLRDFVDAFLNESKKENNNGFTNHQLIFYIRALLVAGTETASSTLSWSLICLLHYPEITKKLREEILSVVGPNAQVGMSYKHRLPYTNAFIQEIMRFRTLFPLNLLHKTNEDAELYGYFIPKDTTIAPNLWAAHNDPNYWDEPEKFKPERFIDRKGEFIQSNHVIPFSIGPRACLGKQLALMEVYIFLVSMVQKFEFLPDPNDEELPKLDDGINGMAFIPYPFRVVAKPL